MPRIKFLQSGRETTVAAGTTLLDAVRNAGLAIDSPCNQTGVCGKCKVLLSQASAGGVSTLEQSARQSTQQQEVWYPACRTAVHGDIEVIEIPAPAGDRLVVLEHGFRSALSHAPLLDKRFDGASGKTLIFAGEEYLGAESGDTTGALYGVAVDIGTTTLVTSLVDLQTGEELASVTELNPQSRYAQDVLSRISFAAKDDGLAVMQHTLMATLQTMIGRLARRAEIDAGNIYELVFSGNTCMLHLATGNNPKSLGRYPYTPLIRGHQNLVAAGLGLEVALPARVYLPPVLSAFVGADITSGILALQLHRQQGVSLLVDIGTNGEIVLADNGRLTATSTAAGPALEGMNISCGMCAGPGAVERVFLGTDSEIAFSTIGAGPAKGFCGSGLIDLIATLINSEVIEANGRFASPGSLPPSLRNRLLRDNGSIAFALTSEVSLSQNDIRQVQLAKGAIRAGIDCLLTRTGIEAHQVDRVLIAGAFGYHLATDSLLALKILPAELGDKVDYVGNTSKTGGQTFLTNARCRQEMADLVGAVDILELSGQEDFERLFVRCLSF